MDRPRDSTTAVPCPFELLETPVALASLDGTILRANAPFRRWTATDTTDLAVALAVDWAEVIAVIAAGKRHTIRGSAKNERGRAIAVEYHLRRVTSDGTPTVVVEGRDLSRVAEKDAMIQSFSKTIEVNNRILTAQKTEIATLLADAKVAYASVQRLLDSVDQGFATLDRSGCILGSRSSVFDRWFADPATGAPFADCLERVSSTTATEFSLAWSQVETDVLPLAVALDQLPTRMSSAGSHYAIHYKPELDDAGALVNLLVVVSDITAEIERGRAESHEKDLLNLIGRFASDRAGFREFLHEADRLVSTITASDVDAVELLRAVHTLKGACALFGAQAVADRCHEFESRVAELGDLPIEADRRLLGAVWRTLRERIGTLLEQDSDAIILARDEFEDVLRRAPAMSPTELLDVLTTWTWDPASKLLARLGDQICALAKRLGKAPVDLVVDGGGLRFDRDHWGRFWSSLAHVVRNMVDHGIEVADERVRHGKPDRGRVTLRTYRDHDRVVVELTDDGRGIDWTGVARKASALGFDATTRDDLVRALLSDGFSMRERVSEHSGRGIGLAAVQGACAQIAGTIEIDSELGQGTTFRFVFPCVAVADAHAGNAGAHETGTARRHERTNAPN